jgi:DNA repair exonuclease SbcCD nuclease subunit
MSLVALITDTHFGARSDSVHFDNFFRQFYMESFWPEIDKHDIRDIIHLGDCFDRRKYINFSTLKSCREYFFDQAKKRNITISMIVGNHDTFFKNTNDVNSPELLLPDYDNVKAYSSPTEVNFDGLDILLMLWICTDNYNESMDTIKNTKAKVCFGHFEIAGFQMYKGHENDEGFDPKIFQKFNMVCSGHFHHRSSNGNINYLGNPYELTWADFEDPRGFHLFDTDTKTLEFIQNPFTIFHKIFYDDSSGQNKPVDLSAVKDSHVKLIVVHKSNFYEFDKFIEALYQQNPLELKIIEDFSEYEANTLFDDNTVDVEDTITLLSHYVDNLDTEADKARIKTIMKTLYVEAQTYDNE